MIVTNLISMPTSRSTSSMPFSSELPPAEATRAAIAEDEVGARLPSPRSRFLDLAFQWMMFEGCFGRQVAFRSRAMLLRAESRNADTEDVSQYARWMQRVKRVDRFVICYIGHRQQQQRPHPSVYFCPLCRARPEANLSNLSYTRTNSATNQPCRNAS